MEDENQIARIDYTYNDIYVGNASVDIAADVSSSYDFDSSIEETPKKVEEDTEENVIFVNIKKILLFVLIGAGILILLFIMKSLLQNYSFSKGHRRTRLRRRRKDKWPTYKFSDKDWKI